MRWTAEADSIHLFIHKYIVISQYETVIFTMTKKKWWVKKDVLPALMEYTLVEETIIN